MDYFRLNNNEWFIEKAPLKIIAKKVGTPCYVYSRAALTNISVLAFRGLADIPTIRIVTS